MTMNQLTQGRTCVSARLVQGLNAECVDTALAAMEAWSCEVRGRQSASEKQNRHPLHR